REPASRRLAQVDRGGDSPPRRARVTRARKRHRTSTERDPWRTPSRADCPNSAGSWLLLKHFLENDEPALVNRRPVYPAFCSSRGSRGSRGTSPNELSQRRTPASGLSERRSRSV